MQFLIDANLPSTFSIWKKENFTHVNEIGENLSDNEIWNYAKQHGYIIVTKDVDFSNKLFVWNAPPKVIHIKVGNIKFQEMNLLLEKNWNTIEKFISNYNLVNVFLDKIEAIK